MTNEYPEENSPDLTDEDIVSAIETDGVGYFTHETSPLLLLSCPSCGGPIVSTGYAVRRRKPDLFLRTTLACEMGHKVVKHFKVNWMEHPQ